MIKQPNFSLVGPRDWDDKPLVILGAGTSLRGFGLERLNRQDIRVLAVKQMAFEAPFAAACIGMDQSWLYKRHLELRKIKMPVHVCFEKMDNPTYPIYDDVFTYHRCRQNTPVLSLDPEVINIGGGSGSAAFGYAVLRGAKDILLLGFDYYVQKSDHIMRGHHYKDDAYPWYTSWNTQMFEHWATWYEKVSAKAWECGVRVINGSPDSLINCFEKGSFEYFMSLVEHDRRVA